jgi:hypothetical protein
MEDSMSLKDILAARKLQTSPPVQKKIEPRVERDEEEDEDFVPYSHPSDKYLSNYEVDPIFLAVHTPLIRDPYDCFYNHFEYSVWMLGQNHRHVLNTFCPINSEVLFALYMKYNPPQSAHELHRLYVAISRICLSVPPIYLPAIEDIIQKNPLTRRKISTIMELDIKHRKELYDGRSI